ncbi:MAG: lipopolysaccharide biosynthesis protein, partial [Acidobacteria bacterium]|nr:lipopolysaccharide biosynthesis protein [Acidobacteriota bacterium]
MADETSFGRRYAAKLLTNSASLLVSLVNVSLMPRALGPAAYGTLEFLLSFFQSATGFWDPGLSTALFTKLSRRPSDVGLLRVVGLYAGLVALLMAAALAAVGLVGV